jgi:hypothetical protein
MGFIKEPKGIDFVVDPTPLTSEERKRISEVIAYYKATGRKMPVAKSTTKLQSSPSGQNVSKSDTLARNGKLQSTEQA